MYVLDASAFIQGNPTVLRGYTTSQVLSELKSLESNAYLWVIGERVFVEDPYPYFLGLVKRRAREIGETRLSEADMSVLALSVQKGLPLVTDDYGLQNVALHLGVEVLDTGFGTVKRVVRYIWKCVACGKRYHPGTLRCPVCGGRVRPYSLTISVVDDTR